MAVIQDFRVRKGLTVTENATVSGNTTIGGFANVAGPLQVTGNSSFTGAAFFGNTLNVTNGTNLSSTLSVSGVSTFGAANATFDTNVLTVDATNNRVGVNTALGQTVAFMVNGAANVAGTLTVTDLSYTGTLTGPNFVAGSSNTSFDGGTLFVDAVNNRVGINVTNPDAALQISGSANVSSNMRVAGSFTGVLASSFSNTLSTGGLLTAGAGLAVTGTANVSSALNVTGLSSLNGNVTTPKITLSTGSTNGIFWPDNAFSGTGDTASITLVSATGEDQRMTFTLTNDAADMFSFNAPSNNGLLMNGYVVWHSGNDGSGSGLDADLLDGLNQTSSNSADTIVRRDGSGNFSAGTITATLSGTASNANALLWNGGYRSATDASTGNSIMARDGNGDTYARYFRGTATSSLYADLAEKYLADEDYIPGTLVSVGGEKEVTASTNKDLVRPLGAISTNPAVMMNSELEGGIYVALRGRVPVRVTGPVTKGQPIGSSSIRGVGVVRHDLYFAIALETNNDPSEKLVEAVIL